MPNKIYSSSWSGKHYQFYGYDGQKHIRGSNGEDLISSFENNPTLITLDQWNDCVNGFVLPEKWCIIRKPEGSELINGFFTQVYSGRKKFTANGVYFQNAYTDYLHYPAVMNKTVFHDVQSGYTLITYEQFKQHVLKTPPMANYRVKGTHISALVVDNIKYRTTQNDFSFHGGNVVGNISLTSIISHGTEVIDGEVLIRIESPKYKGNNFFLVRESDLLSMNNPNPTEISKKIIGYQLIKPEYGEAASKLSGLTDPNKCVEDLLYLEKWNTSIECWRRAGVLDLWFKPVYESEEKIFNMGGFDLKVTKGKVFHNAEDISQYVRELVTFYNTENTFAGYVAKINEITFSKTGCQSHPSKLSDWVKVYEELNRQKD